MRAVVFDIGGVLEITPSTDWRRSWEHRLGLGPGGIDCRLAAVWAAGAVGGLTEAGVRAGISGLLDLDARATDAFLTDLWDEYLGSPNTVLVDFVRKLPVSFPGARLGVLSNSFAGAGEREEAAYGYSALFEEIVYSHECGLLKPDPRAYALVCDRLGVRPGDCLFVDDAEANTTAAEAFGMRTLLFRGIEDTARTIAAVTAHLAAAPAPLAEERATAGERRHPGTPTGSGG
ncbi:HAD-IA family hydrolase [Streptomyces qinzhouensis]|uniref:HAD-IA family hydrolase n=1 Tax=Streptomyces qinzhouensis TaxID=2599401 RepID=A0A5B8JTM2_9ACTN|nr:HAD-IA family hydrolase [Streptomyces qinzhouensis]